MPDYDAHLIAREAVYNLKDARQRLLDAGLTAEAQVETDEIELGWHSRGGWQLEARWRGQEWRRVLELDDEGKLAACALLKQLYEAVRAAFEKRARAAGLLP